MLMSKQGDSGWLIRMPFLMLGHFIPMHIHTVRLLSHHKHEQSTIGVTTRGSKRLCFSTLGGMASEVQFFTSS